jgi:hypothetical protein
MECDKRYGKKAKSHVPFTQHPPTFSVQRYEQKPLTPDEQRAILEVLQDQAEKQRWYVVVVLRDLVAEVAVPLN